ncbi:adenylate/guanylate cyclase domain-containing protein [Leisingera daeponensis]|uniref:adenylate/guanylate cyclase domain-containing protein n=1 Tax=Leisingera daeponensis TaxID=405746 RepID=UPI001C980F79|nr:adenylate/guanylate cyclase domain-containing protein [Leisingera daeponensis]MBY6058376.1 adenylate/guanylate cyclase domain-containing protein [Leisingera daeponensis]
MSDKPQRRLAAIFMLDVFGFSRMMAGDEAGTLNQVLAQQQTLIAPAIRSHGGRIIKLMGDGVLALFPSVIAAVEAAAQIQADAARTRHLQLRIGINLGEVMIAQGDVFGDEVNIAARLESLARPGGVALSAAAYDQVRNRIPYDFEDFGLHEVKNIPDPVQVYFLGGELTSLPSLRRSTLPPKPPEPARRNGMRPAMLLLASCLGAATAVAGIWGWQQAARHSGAAAPVPGQPAAASFEGSPVIAVLPFTAGTLQPDMARMLAQDVIRSLAAAGDVRIIAPSSARAAAGLLPGEAAALLGAEFVVTGHLPGSLREGVKLEILQADAGSGEQVRAEPLSILPPQQQAAAVTLAPQLADSIIRYFGKPLPELARPDVPDEAVLRLLTARSLRLQGNRDRADLALGQAIQMAPDWPEVQALAALWHLDMLTGPAAGLPQRAAEAAQIAAGLPPEAGVLQVRALAAQFAGRSDEALQLAEQLAETYPNDAEGQLLRAWLLHLAGQGGGAQNVLDQVRRLDPLPQPMALTLQAALHLAAGHEGEAAAVAAEALASEPEAQLAGLLHCASLAALGNFDEAGAACARLKGAPLTVDQAAAAFPYSAPAPQRALRTGLSLAGLSGRP